MSCREEFHKPVAAWYDERRLIHE